MKSAGTSKHPRIQPNRWRSSTPCAIIAETRRQNIPPFLVAEIENKQVSEEELDRVEGDTHAPDSTNRPPETVIAFFCTHLHLGLDVERYELLS